MKLSELKKYIREAILAEITVTSDTDTAKKLADQGIPFNYDSRSKQVTEDAKIEGELKTAISAVIDNNPELTDRFLRRAIKNDEKVKKALKAASKISKSEEKLYDPQLNLFINKKSKSTDDSGEKVAAPMPSVAATKKSEEDKKEGERRSRKSKSEDEDVEIEDTYGKLDPEDTSDDDKEPSQVEDDPLVKREKGQIATIQATLKANAQETMKYIKTPENERTPKQKAHLKKMADLTKKLRKLKNPTLQSLIGDED